MSELVILVIDKERRCWYPLLCLAYLVIFQTFSLITLVNILLTVTIYHICTFFTSMILMVVSGKWFD